MDNLKYEKIGEANTRAEAEIIESYLEAEGIDAEIFEESISQSSYVVAMTRIEIFVPKEQADEARELLKGFNDIEPEEDNEDE